MPPSRSPFRRRARPPAARRLLPVSGELRGYSLGAARQDLLAAITVAAVAVPASMAYAELAGLSPIQGLYALVLPGIAYALFGSSRQVSIGPEGALAALTAAALASMAPAGVAEAGALAAALALLVAACFVIARAIRLAWLADYLSRPVLVGYIHGVAIVLIVSQLGKLLGLSVSAADPLPQLAEIAQEMGDVSTTTLAISVIALTALLLLRRFAPRAPGALVVMVVAIVASSALSLQSHGVAVVGDIPSGLPAFSVPRPPLRDWFTLAPAAVGIFLVTFADGILTARSFAGRHGQRVAASQELLAFGMADVAAGLTQGFPVGASNSRTAVADGMNVRTQFGGLLAALMIVVILLFLTGPIADLPKAVLGATIIAAALGLVERDAWRALWAGDRVEFTIAAVTTAGVVVQGVLQAMAFAVGLSIVDVVRRSARPHDAVLGWVPSLDRYGDVAVHPDAQVVPGIVVYRLDDRLFFANADYVRGRVREALRGAAAPARWLVVDMEATSDVDVTGLEVLTDLAQSLQADGVTLCVARLRSGLADHLDRAGLADAIPAPLRYPTVHAAVAACQEADGDSAAEPAR